MSSSYLPQFDALVNEIGNAVAGLFGEPYDVYRLLGTSSGTSVIDPTSKIASRVFAVFEKHAQDVDLDIKLPAPLLTYTASVDITPFRLGDVFAIRRDAYRPDDSIFTLAGNRPMPRVPIFVATPFAATVARGFNPASAGGATATQTTFSTDYGGSLTTVSIPIVIRSGTYAYGATTDTPATVYVGLQMLGRVREQGAALLPDQLPKVNYLVYLPPLGLHLTEDMLITVGQDQFNTLAVLELPTGFYGTICIAEKVQARAV